MAEENTPTEEHEEGGEGDSDLVKTLRQQLKDKDAELKAHRPLVRKEAITQAGFKPDSPHGMMLADLAEKENIPLTKEGIASLAERYGVDPDGSSVGSSGDGSGDKPGPTEGRSDEDSQRVKDGNTVDDVVESGTTVPAFKDREEVLAKIDEAHAAGDVLTVISLQRQLTDVPK